MLLEIPQWTIAQLTDGEEAKTDRVCPELLVNRFAVGQSFAPQLLEVVIGADLRPEQMHNHITGVDQHPIGVCLPLDRDPGPARKRLLETLGQGQHLPARATARDYHLISNRRLAG